MNHYFQVDEDTVKSNPKVIAFRVHNTDYKFHTDHGVFSKDSLDRGTSVLLQYLEVDELHQTALDLGCGYGVVGIYLQKEFGLVVDMVDVNHRALDLAQKNLTLNGVKASVYESDGLNQVTKQFDLIVTNPPIRAGKEVVYRFFVDAAKHLTKNGDLYVVINKKHGAESAFKKLQSIYNEVTLMGRNKGFHVYKCKNPLTI
jgi:16S rRNA (guanine1207-N2)-methyltransferase